jgi:ParB family chromosome partitioning protein
LSIATHLQSFENSPSDPRNEELSQGDLGLDALIGGIKAERISLERSRTRTVPIENLRPNPRNPRRKQLNDDLDELAASIRERGILQPIIARRILDVANGYEIIAGERRWRAAQRAGLHEIPVILHDVDDVESLELAIIENVQRIDLSPLEQASAYQALVDQYGYTQEEVARIIGKSRSCVANMLRLLQLSDKVKGLIQSGVLTASHARMLVGLPNAEQVAAEIVAQQLNVRQVEARAQESAGQAGKNAKRGLRRQNNSPLAALQKRLSDLFGLSVAIDHRGQHGVLRIRYTRLEQLENLAKQIEALRKENRASSEL